MADNFIGYAPTPAGPYRHASAVTPHDTNDLAEVCNALYVGVGGDVAVILANDSAAVVFKGVPTGAVLPVRASRVRATATTATDVVALF